VKDARRERDARPERSFDLPTAIRSESLRSRIAARIGSSDELTAHERPQSIPRRSGIPRPAAQASRAVLTKPGPQADPAFLGLSGARTFALRAIDQKIIHLLTGLEL
jgi:hypothetical protein